MARSTKRRSLELERLESREVMAAGGPSAQAQHMLELINFAHSNPAAAADHVLSSLDGDVTATLSHFGVDVEQTRREIGAIGARPPLAWSDALASAAQA